MAIRGNTGVCLELKQNIKNKNTFNMFECKKHQAREVATTFYKIKAWALFAEKNKIHLTPEMLSKKSLYFFVIYVPSSK